MTLFSTLIPKRNNKILVCSAKRSKEAAAKQTFTLTGANRQNLRVRSTASAQRLDFGGVDVFAHARQRLSRIFCDTQRFSARAARLWTAFAKTRFAQTLARCRRWRSSPYESASYCHYKIVSAFAAKLQRQATSIHIRQKTSYSPKQAFAMRQ